MTPPNFSDVQRYISACASVASKLSIISGWSSENLAWSHKQIARHGHDLRLLSRYSSSGEANRADKLRSRIMTGFAARLCGELHRLHRQSNKAGRLSPLPWDCLEANARNSPLKTGKADQVTLYSKRKNGGGRRTICNPGPRVRAAQAVVSQVLTACGHDSPFDYNSRGRGSAAAVSQVCKLILDKGLTHVVVFDIEQCFPSVRPKHLRWLRLPHEVIRSCICFTDNARLTISYGTWGKTKMARLGLPQGAPASAQIASALLGRELRLLGGGTGIVTYIDDGVIGASSQAEAEQVAKALSTRLANHYGGPIGLKRLEVREVAQGFAFLGYWLRAKLIDGQQVISCSPSHAAKCRAKRRLVGRLRKVGPNLDYDSAVEKMTEYLGNWRRSLALWEPSPHELIELDLEGLSWVDDYLNGWTKK